MNRTIEATVNSLTPELRAALVQAMEDLVCKAEALLADAEDGDTSLYDIEAEMKRVLDWGGKFHHTLAYYLGKETK